MYLHISEKRKLEFVKGHINGDLHVFHIDIWKLGKRLRILKLDLA